jgi:hypothetical protein
MSHLSPLYDSSFAGVSFLELFDDGFGVEPDTAEDVTLTRIPGGNTTVIQSSGRIAKTLDLPIGAEGSEITSLRGKVGTSGSLVYHAGTVTARLIGVRQVRKAAIGGYKAVLNLVIT